jgi:hypothetical protein
MERRLTLAALLVTLLPAPGATRTPIAEVICAPRAEMVERLTRGYGAELAGQGLRDAEAVVEVWADAAGIWVLVQSYANGQACILAMGEGWESLPLPPPA